MDQNIFREDDSAPLPNESFPYYLVGLGESKNEIGN